MKASYRLNIATEPAAEIIADSTEIKNWLKQNAAITADDALVLELEKTARQRAENYTSRAFITQTWDMMFNCSQPRKIDFPLGQLQSVTSVKTIADDGTETTETSSLYSTTIGDRGRLFLKSGNSWTTTTRPYDYFVVRFVCGYGDAKTDVTAAAPGIKTGILQMIAGLYYNRDITVNDVPAAASTLNPYVMYNL
jgi:uncharacterized phiE125 gp8 family phage protein